jgi:hypothetical protein
LDAKAWAMNWEGHNEWFHDTTPFRAFMEGVPPPLLKPQPSCAELAKIHARNSYEQTPLPGRNCRAAKPS